MSKRKSILIGIGLLIVLWLYYTIGMLFFIDVLHTDHRRGVFTVNDDAYPMVRIAFPLFYGISVLYIWIKTGVERTGIAWLGFALLVAITFFYTLAVPPTTYPSGHPPKNDKPMIICNDNGCHVEPPP